MTCMKCKYTCREAVKFSCSHGEVQCNCSDGGWWLYWLLEFAVNDHWFVHLYSTRGLLRLTQLVVKLGYIAGGR